MTPLSGAETRHKIVEPGQPWRRQTGRMQHGPHRADRSLEIIIDHDMIEFSVRQYSAGDADKATGLLRKAQDLAHKIHLAVSDDNKRLKNAEILLRHTAFRLNEMLHASASEDRPLVQETLARVNEAQNEAMMQVFKK